MELPTRAHRAYSDAIISRLRRRYVEQDAVPGPGPYAATPMTFQLLRKLCQHVVAEGYGEQPGDTSAHER
jgi:hypothetical protein